MTPHHDITALYSIARDRPARDPSWDTLRAAEAAEMPGCVNHPGRPAHGGFGNEFYCAECVEWEIHRRRLWMKSFALVQGGVKGLL